LKRAFTDPGVTATVQALVESAGKLGVDAGVLQGGA